ncbi:histone deacetylase/AcuC/AphA family protein [Roseobacter sp. MED193]|uniref:class II histone deacetylase n=1 Tax=Roseobacter sp. MED193 TaxID=314262 RepID=UPI000068A007|nr:class II histone deacetylase [Roseobacter sp. MED193]EAQ43975.1 histone deacetylase/AcuC/AphA family protein [Roseobacter sp. MED193]
MATGLVYHEICMWHDAGNVSSFVPAGLDVQPDRHAEEPETKRRIRNLLDVSGLLDQLILIKPEPAEISQIARVHPDSYISGIEEASKSGGAEVGLNTFIGNEGFDIARVSTGGSIAIMDGVLNGQMKNGYALVRPPGHHARPTEAMGFCIFANASIAIREMQEKYQLDRVAIVDWDAHHGNGAEEIFYEDPSVLTISLHQDNLFPLDSGAMSSIGEGRGEGNNINVPLPPGSGRGAYQAAFDRVVIPALQAYKPQLIVVCSGFDACGLDPLARLMLHSSVYANLTKQLMECADDLCQGRIAMLHEGGYSRALAPYCGLAVMETLSGIKTNITDPFDEYVSAFGGQDLQPHQEAVVNEARGLVDNLR